MATITDNTGCLIVGIAHFNQVFASYIPADCSPQYSNIRVVFDTRRGRFTRGSTWHIRLVRPDAFAAIKRMPHLHEGVVYAEICNDETVEAIKVDWHDSSSLRVEAHLVDTITGDVRVQEFTLTEEMVLVTQLL